MKFKSPNIARNLEMCAKFREGQTPPEIAQKYGLSHTRVHQILHLYGARAIGGRENHESFGRSKRRMEADKQA